MEVFLASFRVPSRAPAVSTTARGPPPNPFFYVRRRKKPSSSVVCMAEPYLVTKLDSAEKAWKEMSVRLVDPPDIVHPVAELDEVLGYDFKYNEFHACVHGTLPYEKLKPDPVLKQLLLSLP